MLLGQSVLAPTGGVDYYTPWMPRQGDAFSAVIEFMRSSGSCTFSCAGQTKNNEDADSSATALSGSPLSVTTTNGVASAATFSGAKELVRYKLTITGTGGSTRWVHFRSNPPIWQPN